MVFQSYIGVSKTTVQYSGISKQMMRMRCEGDDKQTTLYIQVIIIITFISFILIILCVCLLTTLDTHGNHDVNHRS